MTAPKRTDATNYTDLFRVSLANARELLLVSHPLQDAVRPHDLWKASAVLRRKRNSDRARLIKAHKVGLFAAGTLSCAVCGWSVPTAIADESTAMVVHMHHVIPVACGGDDVAENLVALCPNHHTIAHRLGTQRDGRWFGSLSGDELVSDIRLLETDPEGWKRAQQTTRQRYVLRDDAELSDARVADETATGPS